MSLPGVDHDSTLFIWLLTQFFLQGCVLGMLGFIVEAQWLRISHRTRYRLLELCLIALWLLPVVLLAGGLCKLHRDLEGITFDPALANVSRQQWVPIFAAHSPALLAIWLLGVGVLLARLAVSWLKLHSLKVRPVPETLARLIKEEVENAGLDDRILFYGAELIAPLVFGTLRSRLLVPKHLCDTLHEDEIRALLKHEFAHIQRRDYSRNLIQRLFASIFWFHPASWFLLNRLAKLRELCCDEAAARSCSPAVLGRALVKLLARASSPAVAALAQSSLSGVLEKRLLALLHRSDSPPGVHAKAFPFLFTGVLLSAVALAVLHPAQVSVLKLAQEPQMLVRAHDDAGPFELRVRAGKVYGARVGSEVLLPANITQQGTSVSLLNKVGEPALVLTVEPSGSVRWRSRPRP